MDPHSEFSHLIDQQSITVDSAKQLSITNNTAPQVPSVTPKWLLRFLPWEDVNTGIYRINRVQNVNLPQKLKLPLRAETLRTIPLFINLSDTLAETFIKNMKKHDVGPDEIIVKQGNEKGKFYVIVEGQFDVSIQSRHGKELIFKSLSNGDYFGEMALLENVPRQATVTSRIPGKILSIDEKTFMKIFNEPENMKILQDTIKARKRELEHANLNGEIQPLQITENFGNTPLPRGYVSYRENPKEIHLSTIQSIVSIMTRISDVYNTPHDQLENQLKITIGNIHEEQEWEIINNKEFGLLNNIDPSMVLETRKGEPTPDDLDDLIALVWKKPSFFLAHPKTIAAFSRECTFRGVPPATTEIYGSRFLLWRGIPILPSSKMPINEENGRQTADIILMRVGKEDQGVVGLHKASLGTKNVPSLTIQNMGTNAYSVSDYLVTKYFSIAIHVPDAIGVLRNVEIGNYHHYD